MKALILSPVIIFTIILISISVRAQQPDTINKQQVERLRNTLSVNTEVAEKVASVMGAYKVNVNKIIIDKSIGEAQKRAKIDELIAGKNKQLAALLTPEQLRKVVPTTELKERKTDLTQ